MNRAGRWLSLALLAAVVGCATVRQHVGMGCNGDGTGGGCNVGVGSASPAVPSYEPA